MMQELQIGGTRRRRGAINDMVTGRFCVTRGLLRRWQPAGKLSTLPAKFTGAQHVRP